MGKHLGFCQTHDHWYEKKKGCWSCLYQKIKDAEEGRRKAEEIGYEKPRVVCMQCNRPKHRNFYWANNRGNGMMTICKWCDKQNELETQRKTQRTIERKLTKLIEEIDRNEHNGRSASTLV